MELEWDSMLKYYFIAKGFALYLLTSYNLFVKMDIKEERKKLQEKLDKIIEQIETKKQCVKLESPAESRSEEELKTLLKIKNLEKKQREIEAQIDVLSLSWNVESSRGFPGIFHLKILYNRFCHPIHFKSFLR